MVPRDPTAAPAHPDPYPYYAERVVRTPFYHDDTLGLWVACGATPVTAVLTSGLCKVRPPGDPVPAALRGTPLGGFFGQLVRQNDGIRHAAIKPLVTEALKAMDAASIASQAKRWAERLGERVLLSKAPAAVNDFAQQLPAATIAGVLGFEERGVPQVVAWTRDLVAGMAPGANPATLTHGQNAAQHLMEALRGLTTGKNPPASGTAVAWLARRQPPVDAETRATLLANLAGWLTQAYDATAGLIGNTLVALANYPDLLQILQQRPAALPAVVREVSRYDAPVHNTRRFLSADGVIAGTSLRRGDAILVVLAAANRDPAANVDPDRFDPLRSPRRCFTFGAGAHACPGEEMATAIAAAAVGRLLEGGLDVRQLARMHTYRPMPNVRIPVFGSGALA